MMMKMLLLCVQMSTSVLDSHVRTEESAEIWRETLNVIARLHMWANTANCVSMTHQRPVNQEKNSINGVGTWFYQKRRRRHAQHLVALVVLLGREIQFCVLDSCPDILIQPVTDVHFVDRGRSAHVCRFEKEHSVRNLKYICRCSFSLQQALTMTSICAFFFFWQLKFCIPKEGGPLGSLLNTGLDNGRFFNPSNPSIYQGLYYNVKVQINWVKWGHFLT